MVTADGGVSFAGNLSLHVGPKTIGCPKAATEGTKGG